MGSATRRSFFARHRFVIVLAMTSIMPVIGIGALRALRSNVNDVQDWLPKGFKETTEHRWFQRHFPNEQFVLVSWKGCTMNDQRLELLARKLVPSDPYLSDEDAPRPALGSVASANVPKGSRPGSELRE